jgi:hypothetical protein
MHQARDLADRCSNGREIEFDWMGGGEVQLVTRRGLAASE